MKIILLLLSLAGSLCARAQQSLDPLPRTRLFNREYVQFTDWARLQEFSLHWITKNRELRATNATSRTYFTMDSRMATLNGIRFVLSYPVVLQNERVYISVADLKSTLHPVLFPKRTSTNVLSTICIDAGHGGKDPGKMDGKNFEKEFTLLLAVELERVLEQFGFKVVQTRRSDGSLELQDRAEIANKSGADLFVSLHYNAAANRNAHGAEVYCLTPAGTVSSNSDVGNSSAPVFPGSSQSENSVALAYQVQKSLVKRMQVEDRGVKRAQFVVLSAAKMPAILIEAGFMTNLSDTKKIYDSEYRKKMARAIADGIINYKNLVEGKPTP